MNFVAKPDVPWFQHHQRTMNVFRRLDVLRQFRVQIASNLPGDYLAQERLASPRWSRHEQMREGQFFSRLRPVVEIGVDGGTKNGNGSGLSDGVVKCRNNLAVRIRFHCYISTQNKMELFAL